MCLRLCADKVVCRCFHHDLRKHIERNANTEAIDLIKRLPEIAYIYDENKGTLLHLTVKVGNLTLTKYLLEEGCGINATNSDNITALMLAVQNSKIELVQFLLSNGADIFVNCQSRNSVLQTAFYSCLNSDDRADCSLILKLLISKIKDKFNQNREKFIKLLLDIDPTTEFIIAACCDVDIIEMLIGNGREIADFRESDKDEMATKLTSLHAAISLRKCKNVKSLIKLGAYLGAMDNLGRTPLHFYVKCKLEEVDENLEILSALLTSLNNWLGMHETENPDLEGLSDIEVLLMRAKKNIVDLVFNCNVDPDFRMKTNVFCALIANPHLDMDYIVDLRMRNAVNARFPNGKSILSVAIKHEFLDKIDFLLEYGADPNIDNHILPIISMATNPSFKSEITDTLLLYGADLQVVYGEAKLSVTKRILSNKKAKKSAIAHLAMLQEINPTDVSNTTVKMINAQVLNKIYYDLCKQQLNEMKDKIIIDNVTSYRLLTEKSEKFWKYTRKPEFIEAFTKYLEQSLHLIPYYVKVLRKRVDQFTVERVKLEREAIPVVIRIGKLTPPALPVKTEETKSKRKEGMVLNILKYLTSDDVQNLIEAGTFCKNPSTADIQ